MVSVTTNPWPPTVVCGQWALIVDIDPKADPYKAFPLYRDLNDDFLLRRTRWWEVNRQTVQLQIHSIEDERGPHRRTIRVFFQQVGK